MYVLSFAQFLVMSAFSLIIPFIPIYLKHDLGVRNQADIQLWTGMIFGATFLSAFLFQPVWGKIADRTSRKTILIRSALGMAVATFLMTYSTSALNLLVLRFVLGVFGGFIPASSPFITMNTPKENIGYALGGAQSGAYAGNIFGPLIGGILGQWIGFYKILYVSSAMLLIAGTLIFFFLTELNKPEPDNAKLSPQERKRLNFLLELKEIVKRPAIRTLFMAGFLIQFSTMSTSPFLATYVESMWNHDALLSTMVGLSVSISGFSIMIFSPIIGKKADKVGPEIILLTCLFGNFICYVSQALFSSIWLFLLARFLMGVFVGGLLPSVISLIRMHAPKKMESLTFGYYHSALFLGNLIGPLLGGYLSGIIHIKGVILLAGLLFLINGVTFWTVKSSHIGIAKESLQHDLVSSPFRPPSHRT
ncbi:Predicted arabinose efflux permease, MFS family [Paenibacillus tianmuensis]|uniref:Predicted arabinose efflux permease, MFS family n=2 Tax=Paenibacillus tianmuensis TaxID=624147 RepID=A0A1G4TKP8_9BACL|nr:Predicted arabinose efflux permease, MFS family [Paenibacillus tianmuensis]